MHSEATIIAQARERERRYLAGIRNHPRSPRRFDDFLLYLEDNMLDLRALAEVRGLDFKRCAEDYIETVIRRWRKHVRNGDASATKLHKALNDILATLL